MPISDTSPHIQALHDRMIMSMTGEQRLKKALEMTDLVHAFARQGIRDQHPDWSEDQVKRELLRLQFLPGSLPAGL